MDFKALNLAPVLIAAKLDQEDPLSDKRQLFIVPKNATIPEVDEELVSGEDECVYLCSNSLGLQTTRTKEYVMNDLTRWAEMGVTGQLQGKERWCIGEDLVDADMAAIVGAEVVEVAIMNSLTVNEHLLMISFYRPEGSRNKILIEEKAFPSDYYCAESQIRLHDLEPKDCIINLKTREGESILRTEDIIATIREHGASIATVLLSGVQYHTGQLLDIERITQVGHEMGCIVGFDLAHAVGNVQLRLHDWGVDFACWCTYKYLCSGVGGIGGIFVHCNHHKDLIRVADTDNKTTNNNEVKRKILQGWWSHRLQTRFKMNNVMDSRGGAKAYLISNTPSLLIASLRASLSVYKEVNMSHLVRKSQLLTHYLEYLLVELRPNAEDKTDVTVLTGPDRGSQLSLVFKVKNINDLHMYMSKRGFVLDKREPSILRVAPVPLVNTFGEVYRFVSTLFEGLLCDSIIYCSNVGRYKTKTTDKRLRNGMPVCPQTTIVNHEMDRVLNFKTKDRCNISGVLESIETLFLSTHTSTKLKITQDLISIITKYILINK